MADMTLLVKIIGDASSLSKSLDDAQGKLDKMANKGLSGVDSKLQAVGDKCSAVGGALTKGVTAPLVAAGGALVSAAKDTAKYTDNIDKMSQKLGLSREGFQEWDYILSQNGASINSMKMGMKTLTNSLDKVSQKGTTAGTAFERLGISYDDLQGKSQEEVFEMTISALQGVEDETERAALANQLLGKSGVELAPLLNAGAGSVEELKQKAHELGLVIDDETIDAGVRMTDAFDTMQRSFQTIKTAIGSAVMPILAQFAEFIAGKIPAVTEKIRAVSEAFNNLSPGAKKAIGAIAGIAAAAGPALMIGGKAIKGIDGIISKGGILGKILGGLTSPVGLAVLAIGGLVTAFIAASKAPDTLGKSMLEFIKNIGEKFVQFIENLPEKLSGLADKLSQSLSDGLAGMGENVDSANFIASFISTITQVVGAVRQAIIDNGPAIMEALSQIVTTLVDHLSSKASDFLDTGIKLFMMLVEAVGAVLPNIVEAIGTVIPQLVDALITALPVLLNGAITLFMALVNAISQVLPQIIEALVAIVPSLVDALITALPVLLDGAIQLFMAIVEALPVVLPQIIDALIAIVPKMVDALITALPVLLDGAIQLFMAIVDALPEIIPQLLAALGTLVVTIAEAVVTHLPELLTAALEFFGALVTAFVDIHKKVFEKVAEFVSDIGTKLVEKVKEKISAMSDWLGDTWEGIKDTADRVWDGIKDAITGPIEDAKDFVERMIDKIVDLFPIDIGDIFGNIRVPSFELEWTETTAFGKTFSYPSGFDLNWYAKGGLFNRPSVIGVGEAGPEAVTPIDKLKAYVAEAVTNARNATMDYTPIDSLAEAIATGFAMQSAGQNTGGEYHFTVELGGARVAEKIFTLNREGQMIMQGA